MNMDDLAECSTIKDNVADSVCTRITEPAHVHNTDKENDIEYIFDRVAAGFRHITNVAELDNLTHKLRADKNLRLFPTSRQSYAGYIKDLDLWDILTPEELSCV